MSRQRVRPSLGESSLLVCPRCNGQGAVRGTESLALSILRVVEEDAIKDNTGKIVVKIPVEVATFLLNEKRSSINAIEERNDVRVLLIPDALLESPNFVVERVRQDDSTHEVHTHASYELASEPAGLPEFVNQSATQPPAEPAVKRVPPPTPAPTPSPKRDDSPGLFRRLWANLFGAGGDSETASSHRRSRPPGANRGPARNQTGARRRGQGRRPGRGNGRQDARHPEGRRRPERDKPPQSDAAKDDARRAPSAPVAKPEREAGRKESNSQRQGGNRGGARRGRRAGRGRQRDDSQSSASSPNSQLGETGKISPPSPDTTPSAPAETRLEDKPAVENIPVAAGENRTEPRPNPSPSADTGAPSSAPPASSLPSESESTSRSAGGDGTPERKHRVTDITGNSGGD